MKSSFLSQQFKQAWINQDLLTLGEILAEEVTYFETGYDIVKVTKANLLVHLSHQFQSYEENEAQTTILSETGDQHSVTILYKYYGLHPVTQYVVNDSGIFLVPFLEPRWIKEETTIRHKIKYHKINLIEKIVKKFVECRKTA